MALTSTPPRWQARLACTALGLLLTCNAWAVLGGDAASVASDQQTWTATDTQSTVAVATLHSQLLPNGVTVRQYLDSSGRVFAVAWSGPVLPDFARLLGAYYPSYSDAIRQQARGVHVQSATLVIESGGMMRAFVGRAYLPNRLPAGFTAQDIQ